MAYHLTLTAGERKAIDWVGHRYAHGDDLYDVLASADNWDHEEWDSSYSITFTLSEPQAWEVAEIRSACDGLWDCFDDDLRWKMEQFCADIV